MSSNLYKRGFTVVKEEETKIIDSNALIAKKIEKASVSRIVPGPENKDGFSRGLSADVLDVLTGEGEEGNVLHAVSVEEEIEASTEAAMASIEEMKRQAAEELEQMRAEAEKSLVAERQYAMEAAKKQGYQAGLTQGVQEADTMKAQLQADRKKMEAEVDALLQNLEPQLIDAITGIYEHIFRVDLSSHRDIVMHLLAETLRKADGGRSFIIHVSSEDYPYVSMQKKTLTDGISVNSLEVVEDITLAAGDALIETDGGIFDCGLGTQLAELNRKIRLLAYEKPAGE